MTYLKVPVPRVGAGLLSNLLGLAGLLALVCAPGALTGNWCWTLLSGGAAGVALSYLLSYATDDEAEAQPHPAGRHLKAAQR